jgi:hypothetical protein
MILETGCVIEENGIQKWKCYNSCIIENGKEWEGIKEKRTPVNK